MKRQLHRLALALGQTVGELAQRLTMTELADWITYDRTDPIGRERFDVLIAQLCHVLTATTGKAVDPARFLPQWGRGRDDPPAGLLSPENFFAKLAAHSKAWIRGHHPHHRTLDHGPDGRPDPRAGQS